MMPVLLLLLINVFAPCKDAVSSQDGRTFNWCYADSTVKVFVGKRIPQPDIPAFEESRRFLARKRICMKIVEEMVSGGEEYRWYYCGVGLRTGEFRYFQRVPTLVFPDGVLSAARWLYASDREQCYVYELPGMIEPRNVYPRKGDNFCVTFVAFPVRYRSFDGRLRKWRPEDVVEFTMERRQSEELRSARE
jgi:hypothetical protein